MAVYFAPAARPREDTYKANIAANNSSLASIGNMISNLQNTELNKARLAYKAGLADMVRDYYGKPSLHDTMAKRSQPQQVQAQPQVQPQAQPEVDTPIGRMKKFSEIERENPEAMKQNIGLMLEEPAVMEHMKEEFVKRNKNLAYLLKDDRYMSGQFKKWAANKLSNKSFRENMYGDAREAEVRKNPVLNDVLSRTKDRSAPIQRTWRDETERENMAQSIYGGYEQEMAQARSIRDAGRIFSKYKNALSEVNMGISPENKYKLDDTLFKTTIAGFGGRGGGSGLRPFTVRDDFSGKQDTVYAKDPEDAKRRAADIEGFSRHIEHMSVSKGLQTQSQIAAWEKIKAARDKYYRSTGRTDYNPGAVKEQRESKMDAIGNFFLPGDPFKSELPGAPYSTGKEKKVSKEQPSGKGDESAAISKLKSTWQKKKDKN